MSFPILSDDTYTTDFIYSLPEGKRAELIDGQIQFLGIADNRDIRFYIVSVILVKEYGKWGKKRFARAAL